MRQNTTLLILGVLLLGLGAASTAATDHGGTVGFSPTNQTVQTNGSATYAITISHAEQGVGAYELTLNVSNATIASIVNVSSTEDAEVLQKNVSENGSTAYISAIGLNITASANTEIASVTVTGQSTGSTQIMVTQVVVGDTEGTRYDISAEKRGTLIVRERTSSGISSTWIIAALLASITAAALFVLSRFKF